MDYQVFAPSVDLQPFVKCFWTLEAAAEAASVKQRVLPDGCMEMIFHYGDHFQQFFEDGSSLIQPKSFVFGQITRFIEIAPTGVSGIVAARFLPEGLMPFLSVPVLSLDNKATDIATLFGEAGRDLEEGVLTAPDNRKRMELIESFLLSRLADPQTIDRVAKSCVEAIFQSQGQMGMAALADKMNINRRNMERKFTTAIGLSPKQLSRVARLQAALKLLGQKKFTSLTALAYESGYYDQAHFIRDFKEFAGISPKSFFSDNLKLSSLFVTAD